MAGAHAMTSGALRAALHSLTFATKVALLHNCKTPTVRVGAPADAHRQEARFREDVAAFGALMHTLLFGSDDAATLPG